MRFHGLSLLGTAVLLTAGGVSAEAPPRYVPLESIATGRQPKDLLFSPDDRFLMITLLADTGVDVYDTLEGTTRRVEPPQEHAANLGFVEGVLAPGGGEYWFTQMRGEGYVHVLELASWQITSSIPTGGVWSKVGEFDPRGRLFYVSNWLSNDVSVIDASSGTILERFECPGGREPRGIGFSADGSFVYVVFYASGEIMKFAVEPGYPLVRRIVTGGVNGRFRADHRRGVAYVTNMHLRKFFVLDLSRDEIVREVRCWSNPNNLKLSPTGRYIYVSNRGPNNPQSYLLRSPEDGRVQVFDADRDFSLVAEIGSGNQPIGIAVTSDHATLAVSNFQDDTVDFYTIDRGE